VLQIPLTYCHRHLPHWQPEGVTLFVTWRLHGSFPRAVKPALSFPPGVAFAAMDRELDAAATGPRWIEGERVAQFVIDVLHYGERRLGLYKLRAWVLMINHVHILIDPEVTLPKITKSIKNYSARQANEILGRTGEPFWQDESYDHWVRNSEEFGNIVRYIEENPVIAGLVKNAAEWRWSSAFGESRSR
jgi:putative transposase